MPSQHITILLVEDTPADILLFTEAFHEACTGCDLRVVPDGEVLFQYLNHWG